MTSASSTKFSEMDFETSYEESKDTDFSPKQESIDVAHELLKDGKVSLENEFIPAAIEELSSACDIFASVFGVSAPECAEAFYFYGKALLAGGALLAWVLRDEVGDLQMALEMLELAKNAWTKISKSSTGDMKKEVSANLAEVHLSLGEVAMDSGNYSQAQEDFTVCIDLKKTALPADARSLADAWYQLGVVQAFSGKFAEAETSLKSAVAVLEARKISQPEEVEELEEVVKEIGEEVAQHKNMEKEGRHYGPGGKLTQSSVAVGGLSLAAGPITGGSA